MNLRRFHHFNRDGVNFVGYGGFLSRTSSNVSSLATSSDEEATTTGASSVSGSDAENVCFSTRRKERVTRRASLGPKVEGELEKTPTKASRPAGRTTPCPSPAGSLRSGVHRALVLPQPSLKSAHSELQTHFELEENPSFWDDHNVQVGYISSSYQILHHTFISICNGRSMKFR